MSMGKMVLSYEDTVSRMSELLTSASERDHCASRKKSSLTVWMSQARDARALSHAGTSDASLASGSTGIATRPCLWL